MGDDGSRHHRCTGHHQAAPEAFQLSECVPNDAVVRICISLSGTDYGAQFYLFKGHGKFSAGVSVNELGNVGWLGLFPGSMQAQASGDGRFARPICSQRQPRQRKGQRGGGESGSSKGARSSKAGCCRCMLMAFCVPRKPCAAWRA